MRLPAAVAAVCLVAACGSAVEAWRSTSGDRHLVPFRAASAAPPPVAVPPNAPVPKPTSPATTTHSPATTKPPAPTPANVAPPVMVDIPAVGLTARVVPVGLNGQGQIQMPSPTVAGWYRLGPAPGAVGPAVIVGHVDTYTGPAVFYRLTGARTGDEVDVVRADGSRARFVISAVTTVNKAAFPSHAVFGPTKGAAIRLITCTGAFNLNTRHYVDSLIAWGVPAT